MRPRTAGWPRAQSPAIATAVEAATPPNSPQSLFDGEMWASNLRLPRAMPTQYAPVSNDQTIRMTSRIQPRPAPSPVAGAPEGRGGATSPSLTSEPSMPTYTAVKAVPIQAPKPIRVSFSTNAATPAAMSVAATSRSAYGRRVSGAATSAATASAPATANTTIAG